jgi:hypothetical protein
VAATQEVPCQQVTSASYVTLGVFTSGVSPPANALSPKSRRPKSRSGHESSDLKNTSGAFSTVEDYGHTSFIREICKEAGSREG